MYLLIKEEFVSAEDMVKRFLRCVTLLVLRGKQGVGKLFANSTIENAVFWIVKFEISQEILKAVDMFRHYIVGVYPSLRVRELIKKRVF
ncbi:hypothetical protein [Caldicellulosiruptor acetigenus]|uniref:hypothetical protein n=1 Tax=Caldicellulosiruptor acetigenus TaxID=301953 RepID=UPI001E38B7F1|nr:hypothetical protein [Caldicellulosiruptor acetigenus]